MTTQSYLIIESGVVTNIVMWDGNPETWTPPTGSIQIIKDTVTTKLWESFPQTIDGKTVIDWELVEKPVVAEVGYTWDGQYLITNDPKPEVIEAQPITQGTQTL